MRRIRLTLILSALGLLAADVVVGHVIAQSGGSVTVMTGPADKARIVCRITAGTTGRIAACQWIVEQPWTPNG